MYFLFADRKYNPSNWTIPTLPSLSRQMQQRRLRSTNFDLVANPSFKHIMKTGLKKYPCYDCGNSFGLRATLMRHKNFECDKVLIKEMSKAPDDKPSIKKRYVCSKCQRSYTIFKSLWRHQHYECGIEAKYCCDFCSHKTKYKDSLMKHIMSRHMQTFMPNL